MNKRLVQAGLTIGGTPFEAPSGLDNVTPDKAGPFGENLLQLGVELMFIVALLLTLGYLIWGGISWIMSGGDKHGVEAAKMKITYAIIGLVVVFSAFFIISLIGYFFDVPLLKLPTT